MPNRVQNQTSLLAIVAWLTLTSAICSAQEPTTPSNAEIKPTESAKQAEAPETPSPPAPAPSANGVVDKPSDWATATTQNSVNAYVPAVTSLYDSPDEAKSHLNEALETAFRNHLKTKVPEDIAYRLTPPASTINERFARDNLWEVLRIKEGDAFKYQAAKRLDIMNFEVDFLISEYYRKKAQFSAVGKTLFLGGGLLGFVAILAASARLNHATSGKRSGILRAASMIAILSLLGGLMTAGVLGRVFTS